MKLASHEGAACVATVDSTLPISRKIVPLATYSHRQVRMSSAVAAVTVRDALTAACQCM